MLYNLEIHRGMVSSISNIQPETAKPYTCSVIDLRYYGVQYYTGMTLLKKI